MHSFPISGFHVVREFSSFSFPSLHNEYCLIKKGLVQFAFHLRLSSSLLLSFSSPFPSSALVSIGRPLLSHSYDRTRVAADMVSSAGYPQRTLPYPPPPRVPGWSTHTPATVALPYPATVTYSTPKATVTLP